MLKRWRIRILLFLAVLGPGFITANIDNDSGGILTYSNAGAQFGYTLLWTMIPITVALLVVQEMCARMGAVTGKGLSDLIREEFGLRMTFLLMLLLMIVNFGNVMAEFAGIAGSMQLFHVSKFISVPVAGGQRRLQGSGKSLSGSLGFLHRLYHHRGPFPTQLARRPGGHGGVAPRFHMAL
jgi:Mn2+/Fe2+ NRAMP family transporter